MILHHLRVWREAAALERQRPRRPADRDGTDFLPAAIEVMEKPPSPVGRLLLWLICAFLVLALLWAWLGRVDIVAVAQGRTIPSGRVKVVQAPELGVVRAIHVSEGQKVKAGDPLIDLDPTISGADRDRLAREALAAALDKARLEPILADPDNPEGHFTPPSGATPEMLGVQQRLMAAEAAKFRANIAGLDAEERRRAATRDVSLAQLDKLTAAIPLLRDTEKAVRTLATDGHASKLRHNEVKERLVSTEKDHATESQRLREAEAALAAVRQQRRQAEQEFRTQILKELATSSEKQAAAEQELKKATQRLQLQALRAPVDGTVQQLAATTVGGVVQPAETLMVIVPSDAALEIEAALLNKDVGFVRVGQRAEIKLEAFPYTIYGALTGEVIDISADAVVSPTQGVSSVDGRPSGRGTAMDASKPPAYTVRVRLDRAAIEVNGRALLLGPGLAAAIEIRTGTRTVLAYVLDPIVRYRSEVLRER